MRFFCFIFTVFNLVDIFSEIVVWLMKQHRRFRTLADAFSISVKDSRYYIFGPLGLRCCLCCSSFFGAVWYFWSGSATLLVASLVRPSLFTAF